MSNDDSRPRGIEAVLLRNEVRDLFRLSFLANITLLPVYETIQRDHGLNRAEYLLLFCLAQTPHLTAQDVANVTGRPRNSISRAVHRVLERGLIHRTPDPDDGRQARLRITAAGRRLHQRIVTSFIEREAALLDVLDAGERRALDRILARLVENASALSR